MNARRSRAAASTRHRALLLAMAALGLGACEKKSAVVNGPPPPPPPTVAAVSPVPRAVAVPVVDPEIWAEFTEPLEPATVNDRTVYLKIDDTRIPIVVTYEAASRRIVIEPVSTLERLNVYTVEISTQVRTASGGGFERTWFWQFTTFAIQPPTSPIPASGAIDQSMFVRLRWSGNEDSPGGARYELYWGIDAAAVAAHTMAPVSTGQQGYYFPRVRWPAGTVVYWSVRAISLETGEHIDSPVWSFTTRDPTGAVIDSFSFVASETGYQNTGIPNQRGCNQTFVTCGPNYWSAIRWNVGSLPENLQIVSARIQLRAATGSDHLVPAGATVWAASQPFAVCSLIRPGFDDASGALAPARTVAPATVVLQSDLLAAHLEAMRADSGTLFGYLFRAAVDINWAGVTASDPANRPRLIVYYYP